MTIATIKNLKTTERGGWSVIMEDNSRYLCMKDMSSFKQGDKVEFNAIKKTTATGKDWYLLDNPHIPESKILGGTFGPQGRGNDWSIFVTGIVGRAMGSGKFGITDIKGLSLAALEAWIDTDAKHKQHVTIELSRKASLADDEIQF